MEDPDWATILNYLYDGQEKLECELKSKREIDEIKTESLENKGITTATGLSPKETKDALEFLVEQNLCKKDSTVDAAADSGSSTNNIRADISITPDGFDVAHERKQNQNSQKLNQTLVLLTWILAGTAMIQALTAIVSLDGSSRTLLSGASIGILVTVLVGVVVTSDLFD